MIIFTYKLGIHLFRIQMWIMDHYRQEYPFSLVESISYEVKQQDSKC
jgi:hypothetical protein